MSHSNGGIKLRDLLVAVAVIAVLFSLVTGVCGGAREAARRTQCQNNMRQIGLGLTGFSNSKQWFPNAGTIYDDPLVHQGDPTKSNIYQAMMLEKQGKGASIEKTLFRSWVVSILPYVDVQCLYDTWNNETYYSNKNTYKIKVVCVEEEMTEELSNANVSSTAIGILRCPDDSTCESSQGNLSYVVNGGFSRWPAYPVAWSGNSPREKAGAGEVLRWAGPGGTWQENQEIGKKLGVMFLGTQTGDQPWDIKTRPTDIVDGTSTTILIGENMRVGYSPGTPDSAGIATNWACPLPNFCMFFASDDVCRTPNSATDCLGGQLKPTARGETGAGWSRADGLEARKRAGSRGPLGEGSFPFANSGHPGGSNFVFCDGATRFISNTIDGKVYAELITPAGTALPPHLRHAQNPNLGDEIQ
ncbi:DUF1559 domain-containing protein [Singulisphaera sp. PoT]|uniref:DUF1559 family PulG-like putative transporter n=1 Tax=Singulisphaera sp. PoT TaxID=3411797 RepID=UPI003BF576D5